MKSFALILSVLLSVNALAARPPYGQSAKEIAAIALSPEVAARFSSAFPITSIEQYPSGDYNVVSGKCGLTVKIVRTQTTSQPPGPVVFSVQPTQMYCQ